MKIKDHLLILNDGAAAKTTLTRKKGGRIVPVGIVLHYTAGYTTAGDVDQLSRAQAAVSAHVVVGRDGEIVQIVPFNEAAWHAGPSFYKGIKGLNARTIGIEISNCGWLRRLPDGNYKDQYNHIIRPDGTFTTGSRKLMSAPKTWLHQKHKRLGNGEFAWETYYEPQLKAVEDLIKALLSAYDIQFIVSHEEIDTRQWKTDPGPAFPMERFQKLRTAAPPRVVKGEIGTSETQSIWRRAWDYFRK